MFARRLLLPLVPELITDPDLVLEPRYASRYADLVEAAASQHLGMMAELDQRTSFAERVASGKAAYVYLREYVPALSPDYWDWTDVLVDQLGDIPPGIEMTVIACVGLEFEQDTIYHNLKQYGHQTKDHTAFEVVLYLNAQGSDSASVQQTMAEIARFQNDYPSVNLRAIGPVLLPPDPKLSTIKKTAMDAVVTRWAQSQQADNPNYTIVSNDADAAYLHPEYLARYATEMAQHPETDIAVQTMDLDHKAFRQLGAEFLLGSRVRQSVERQMDTNSGLFYPEGGDTALRPAVYCALGGLMPELPYGEDYGLGKLLIHYRGGTHSLVKLAPCEVGIQTSARRPAYQYAQSIEASYNSRDNVEDNDAVHRVRYSELETILPLEARIALDISRILELFGGFGLPADHPIVPALFTYYGVELESTADGYVIHDASAYAQAYQRQFGGVV